MVSTRELGINGGSVLGGVLVPELLEQFADGPASDVYLQENGQPLPLYLKPSCIIPIVGGALGFIPLIPQVGAGEELQMAGALFGTTMLVKGAVNVAKEMQTQTPPAAMITGGKPYEQRVGTPRTYMDVV